MKVVEGDSLHAEGAEAGVTRIDESLRPRVVSPPFAGAGSASLGRDDHTVLPRRPSENFAESLRDKSFVVTEVPVIFRIDVRCIYQRHPDLCRPANDGLRRISVGTPGEGEQHGAQSYSRDREVAGRELNSRKGRHIWAARSAEDTRPPRGVTPLIAACFALWPLWIVGCTSEVPRRSADEFGVVELEPSALPACPTSFRPSEIDTIAAGLEVPWDVAFLSDERALVTERPGRIRVIEDGVLLTEPWAVVGVDATAEAGLMGIDVREVSSSRVDAYVAATLGSPQGGIVARALAAVQRRIRRMVNPESGHSRYLTLLRITESDGRVGSPESIVPRLPSAPIHAGGAVRIGPDGTVYLSNGDAASPWRAQDPSSTRGKILRYETDGSIPADNPFPGSPVWVLGVRESQGIAWHPDISDPMAIDHGPTGLSAEDFRTGHDELNVVARGTNLGWPVVVGPTSEGDLAGPLNTWDPAIAPGGLAVYDSPGSPWHGNAFVTALRGESLRRIEIERRGDGLGAVCEEILLRPGYGRLRLIRQHPDGTLWVGTSNSDQNGTRRPEGDLILGLTPPS